MAGGRECSRENFLFSNVEPWKLCSPQYRTKWMLIAYAVFKWLAFLFFNTFLWYSIFYTYCPAMRAYWLIYLTNWAYTIFNLSLLVNAISVTVNLSKWSDEEWQHYLNEGRPTWYLQLNWILYLVSSSANVLVVVLYWALVHKPGETVGLSSIVKHGVIAVHSIGLDMWVTAMPVKALQFWPPALLVFCYSIYSLIYDVSVGTNEHMQTFIYRVLDWTASPPRAIGYSFVAIGSVVIGFFLIFVLFKLRTFLYDRCCRSPILDTGASASGSSDPARKKLLSNDERVNNMP